MEIVEVRLLEGPNLFLLEPAVKVEVVASELERQELAGRISDAADSRVTSLASAWADLVGRLSQLAGLPAPATATRDLDERDHLALAFGWSRRGIANVLAKAVRTVAEGGPLDVEATAAALRQAAEGPDDPPDWVRDGDRETFTVAVTGTNGKTTTTRLLAHIARTAGGHVAWSSTSGVYVDGGMVEEGDYSGPSGAARVLASGVDVGIVETARGGILLKGLGYESNDVSVFTNVSGDHLGLHGVLTVETIAAVKSVVCRVTRPDGVAVVNADDPLVMAETSGIAARRCLFSRHPDADAVATHAAGGGAVVISEGSEIRAARGDEETLRVSLADVPLCYGGKAVHQVENAMAAVGAALGAGIPREAIEKGLRTFGTQPEHNPGRLEVMERDGYTVVVDYAHNEAGLRRLLEFGRGLTPDGGRLVAVIGSAGDRDPAMLRSLGAIAAGGADAVIAKGTDRYLRGIEKDALVRLYREGAASVPGTPYEEVDDEWAAVRHIAASARAGDVYVLMFQEAFGEVRALLEGASSG